MNLNDKRVIQTRQKLRTALLTLMQRKPVSQITVKEICDEALTNRNTFYAHYGAPVDILVQIQQEYNEKMQLLRQEAIRTGDVQTLILGIMVCCTPLMLFLMLSQTPAAVLLILFQALDIVFFTTSSLPPSTLFRVSNPRV